MDVGGGGPTAFHGLNTGFCREKRLLVYILACCTHELTLLCAASAFAAFEGCLLSLQQIEEGKVLKVRNTLGNRYLVAVFRMIKDNIKKKNLSSLDF